MDEAVDLLLAERLGKLGELGRPVDGGVFLQIDLMEHICKRLRPPGLIGSGCMDMCEPRTDIMFFDSLEGPEQFLEARLRRRGANARCDCRLKCRDRRGKVKPITHQELVFRCCCLVVLAINRLEGWVSDQLVYVWPNRCVIWGWLNAWLYERGKEPELWELGV